MIFPEELRKLERFMRKLWLEKEFYIDDESDPYDELDKKYGYK